MMELNERIAESGIKKGFIAEKLGISKQTFSYKLKGRIAFSIPEAIGIKNILGLTDEEFFYFFAPKVEKRRKSTNEE